MAISDSAEVKSLHWDIAKLLELGVKQEAMAEAKPEQIKDLLKGILYLKEKYSDHWQRMTASNESAW